MNLIFHIVKKDLRRFWIPIALFAGVVAIKLVIGAFLLWGLEPGDAEIFAKLNTYANLLGLISGVVVLVLVAAVVHEDSLVGTQAFWMTKPISGGRLLATKLTTLFIIVIMLPVLVTLPWWLACGFGPRDIIVAAWGSARSYGSVAVLALPFAVLTGTTGRYLAALLISLILGIVAFIFQMASAINSLEITVGVAETRYWMTYGVVALGIGVIVTHQYLTRRWTRSAVLFAVTFVTALVIARTWPWVWSPGWSNPQNHDPELARSIKLSVQNARFEKSASTAPDRDRVWANFIAAGVPSKYQLSVTRSENSWLWPDGTKLKRRSLPSHYRLMIDPAATWDLLGLDYSAYKKYMHSKEYEEFVDKWFRAIAKKNHRSYRGPFRVTPVSDTCPYRFPVDIDVPEAAIERLRTGKPSYTFDGWFDLLQPALLGEASLRDGAIIRRRDRGVRIGNSALNKSNELAVSLTEWLPTPDESGLVSFDRGDSGLISEPSNDLLLMNRRRSDAVSTAQTAFTHTIDVAGVRINWRTVLFQPLKIWNNEEKTWQAEPSWFHDLHDLTLAKFVYRNVSTFHRHLEIAHLKVVPVDSGGDKNK